ncbi:hypothetical protein KO02_15140 [Sphingobacterium sp. ML3W]|uniref:carboxypeptidase-like regulatory domain-containing protein n=1 Tax=Sphingobacterium sp. ML3W TaxID=1538644 RepID=UPI0004F92FD0|nr:carboxypeptidase-like regulatory domain-containing protein [Sphingobacterium sp. ML3W]AIM37873.1 hypothetical protein KO02_15140 [Sphingobacterium sp. ML3W]
MSISFVIIRKFVLLGVILCLINSCSPSIYTLRKTVIGYVYNEQQQPLQNVQISFVGNNAFSNHPVQSNEKGQFVIPALQFKKYKDVLAVQNGISRQIILYKEGFATDTVSLENAIYDRNMRIVDTIQLKRLELKKNP